MQTRGRGAGKEKVGGKVTCYVKKRAQAGTEKRTKQVRLRTYGGEHPAARPGSHLSLPPLPGDPALPREEGPPLILGHNKQTWRRRSETPRDSGSAIRGAARTAIFGRGGSACSRRPRGRCLRGGREVRSESIMDEIYRGDGPARPSIRGAKTRNKAESVTQIVRLSRFREGEQTNKRRDGHLRWRETSRFMRYDATAAAASRSKS